MNWWDWYWLAWLLLGFALPEAYALYRAIRYKEQGGTLSENVREWFATDVRGWSDKSGTAKIRRILLLLGMTWLIIHWLLPGLL